MNSKRKTVQLKLDGRERGITESEALAVLKKNLRTAARSVRLGIGDDACVLSPRAGPLLCTVDACDEGSHYLFEWMTPEQIAHKAIHAAVSDLAAMGARPHALLCHVALSPRVDLAFFQRFTRAQARVSRALKCVIVGGNLSFGPRLSVVTTALGAASERSGASSRVRPLTRASARAGDELWLVGRVGLARLGLLLLKTGLVSGRGAAAEALAAFRAPHALIREGALLLNRARSCMDVSDGLRRDAQTLAQASRVRVVINAEQLLALWPRRISELALRIGEDPLEVALEGGEDYALLATGSPSLRPACAHVIGRVERGEGAYVEQAGRRAALSGGFEHGARGSGSP